MYLKVFRVSTAAKKFQKMNVVVLRERPLKTRVCKYRLTLSGFLNAHAKKNMDMFALIACDWAFNLFRKYYLSVKIYRYSGRNISPINSFVMQMHVNRKISRSSFVDIDNLKGQLASNAYLAYICMSVYYYDKTIDVIFFIRKAN